MMYVRSKQLVQVGLCLPLRMVMGTDDDDVMRTSRHSYPW
jgi:hypothetical protein